MGSRIEEGSPTDPGCPGSCTAAGLGCGFQQSYWCCSDSSCLEPGAAIGEMSQSLDTGAKPSIS